MKKIIFMLIAMFTMAIGANAQNQKNVKGSSNFTDNWNFTVQAGAVSPFAEFYKNGSVTPIVIVGANKYVNPWLSLGVDARTSIGTGSNFNPHTAFDMVNINGIVKFNVLNAIKYNGVRKNFEVNPYVGIGWNHVNCSDAPTLSANYNAGIEGVPTEYLTQFMRNSVAFRAGLEFVYNFGKAKNNGVIVNLSDVWGNVDNMRLVKNNGNFEASIGYIHYFKTSNGTSYIKKAEPIIVDRPVYKEKIVERIIKDTKTVVVNDGKTYAVSFAQNSAELTNEAKAVLDEVVKNVRGRVVDIAGSTSPEGTSERNTELATQRAEAVAEYLKSKGVKVNSVEGGAAGRAAVITIQ